MNIIKNILLIIYKEVKNLKIIQINDIIFLVYLSIIIKYF